MKLNKFPRLSSFVATAIVASIFLTHRALAYRAPFSLTATTVTHYNSGGQIHDTYSITDPLTGQSATYQTLSLYGAPTSLTTFPYADGIAYIGTGYQDELGTNPQNFIGFVVYDPAQGQWKPYIYNTYPMGASYVDGTGAFLSYTRPMAIGQSDTLWLTLTTYDPSTGDWATRRLDVADYPDLDVDYYIGTVSSGGMLIAYYPTWSNGDWATCAIYDPTRKSWQTISRAINRSGSLSVNNGVATYTPPSGQSGGWQLSYSFSSGSWVSGQNSTPVSLFYVQKSYSSNPSYSNARWVTDMSFGSSRALDWGDGTLATSGGGLHNYASSQQYTLTQAVSGWHGDTVYSSRIINTPPNVSLTVDGYSPGAYIVHPAGSQPTVTVHFSATATEGTLAGLRYQALYTPTGALDNNNGGWVTETGTSAQITRTYTLGDGDWYFWTDAIDSNGVQSSTGPYPGGFKITVASDSAPSPTISVDGYSSGAVVHHNYGQSVTVTVHYNATDVDGNLTGIRYNEWNPSTSYFDNGGGGFVTESGNSGQVTKTFTLSEDGDWYFWTDAQDALGGYASTGDWQNGFKITLVQNGQPAVTPSPSAYLANLSLRGQALGGDGTMITGFVLSGGTSDSILVDGKGPSLNQYGLDGITDPSIYLYQNGSVITSNNDWQSAANAAQIAATPYAPGNSKESTIYQSLNSGAYTVMMTNGGSGTIGLMELYDMSNGTAAKVVNISGRANVGTGNNVLIAGFIIAGGPKRVIINGKGPSLTAYGVSGALADPVLTLYDGSGTGIESNNNWQTAWNATDIANSGYAPGDPNEATIDEVLPAGVYSVFLSGASNGTGIGLVEINGL